MNHAEIVLGLAAATVAALALLAVLPDSAEAGPSDKGVLSFTMKNIDGKDVSLSKYKGNVVLVVNTASKCGLTPQYASLEKLYATYKDKGLRILAFPANNFGGQEPGTNTEIKEFCSVNYKTTFDLFSKISVKGEDQHPLYKFLTGKETNPRYAGDIEWNFAKFLVDRSGQVVARIPANKDPLTPEVVSLIEEQLSKPAPKKS